MRHRTENLILSTASFLDESHDYFDPAVLKTYREALAKSDLENGQMPDGLTVSWTMLGGVRTARIDCEGAPKDTLLFHIHGGGWCGGVPCTALQGMLLLQRRLGLNLISVEYGLAPEHPYPEGIQDCIHAYQALLDSGFHSDRIVLIGESAGGYYCLALTQYLRDKGIALPAGLCLVSPGAEMFDPNELKQALIREPNNAVLQQSFAFSTMYTNGHGLDEPYMSPNRGSYRGFPPMLIQTGGIDFCRDMSLRCANQAAAEGVDVKLHSWEFMPHVFFLLHDIPEAEEGRNELAEFIESVLK